MRHEFSKNGSEIDLIAIIAARQVVPMDKIEYLVSKSNFFALAAWRPKIEIRQESNAIDM